jgi:hypothetical protein
MPAPRYTWDDFDQLVEQAEAVKVTISKLDLDELEAKASEWDSDYQFGWADRGWSPLRYRVDASYDFYADPSSPSEREDMEVNDDLCEELEQFIKTANSEQEE